MAKKVARKKVARKIVRKKVTKKVAKKRVLEPIVDKKVTKKKVTKKKATKKSRAKKTCFVMMPFQSPFDVYFDAIIEPAVKAASLEPKRADSLFTPTPIVADIWRMIQDAEVLLADVTTKNPNVFYELGLAHAIGKPVVMISETMDDVPFDLQQLRVILYDKQDPVWGEKLRGDIKTALGETLKDPAGSVPDMFKSKVKSQAPKKDDSDTSTRIALLERQFSMLRHELKNELYGESASLFSAPKTLEEARAAERYRRIRRARTERRHAVAQAPVLASGD